MIELINVKKQYENVTPIECLNATINKGDIITIIGPSGTGKSTFLRMINMMERPTSGKVLLHGEDITAHGYPLHKVRQKVGMVFQSFNLFNHRTVLENVIDAPIFIRKENADEAGKKGMELLRTVGMAKFADAYPSSLSGGQKQRVAIARTLAMEPEVILFDEPTSALDPTMVGEVELVIKQLSEQGYTMMLVTHDMQFAESISNRVFFMAEGMLYEEGTPEQIFHHPLKEKTKEFVMSLRTISATINSSNFDYISFKTSVENFIYKNEIPSEEAYKLRALTEELVAGISLHSILENEDAGKSYDIKISYSHKKRSVRIYYSWNEAAKGEAAEEFAIQNKLIVHYADDITIDGNSIKIKLGDDRDEE